MQKKTGEGNPIDKYKDGHPFEKVFEQVEEILDKMETNKHKSLEDIPEWVADELTRVEKEFQQLQKSITHTIGNIEIDEKKYRKLMREIPEEKRPIEAKLVEKAKRLKARAEIIKRDYYQPQEIPKPTNKAVSEKTPDTSPMSLIGKESSADQQQENLRSSLEHKKKYGKIGGKKNWRPL